MFVAFFLNIMSTTGAIFPFSRNNLVNKISIVSSIARLKLVASSKAIVSSIQLNNYGKAMRAPLADDSLTVSQHANKAIAKLPVTVTGSD